MKRIEICPQCGSATVQPRDSEDYCEDCGWPEENRTENIMNKEQIAIVCHEANRAYCKTIGDDSQPSWEDAPQWQRDSAIKGVEFCLENPTAPPSANHESWLAVKEAEGWEYGPVKDPEKKQHPCYVPYDELPEDQKRKDSIFKNIVAACA